jgi:hypothetical protein
MNDITINIKDIVEENGLTTEQNNLNKKHNIKIGSLVELENGVRLFIVKCSRDCDGTPLYYLCHDPEDTLQRHPGFSNLNWIGGYSEDSLKVIK